jgi:hypothetical protein
MAMNEPFIFINTYAIKPGRAADYEKVCRKVVEIADANEPRLLHFGFYINEEGTEGTTVQVHPDADSMAFHMQLVAEHINQAREYLDFSTMSVQVYGKLSDAVLDQMRQLAGSGVPVTIRTQSSGFNRLPAL